MFFVNIKKVKRIKTFLLQFPHLGCHEVEWSPGLGNDGYGQMEGRLRRWLAAGELRSGPKVSVMSDNGPQRPKAQFKRQRVETSHQERMPRFSA